jgi:alkylated DNA repair dioxygenase AlkB
MFSSSAQGTLFGVESKLEEVTHHHSNGADLRFVPKFLSPGEADRLLSFLEAMPGWQQDHIRLYGKSHPLPRLHRWFADSSQPYRWSGIEMRPEPFPEVLREMVVRLEAESGVRFNTALGNRYRDGRDGVSWHADDERELGPDPVIASLSLGAPRRFLLRKRDDHSVTMAFELTHGSLLWMSGTTQTHWEHSIPKTTRSVGTRINLTFRAIR